MFVELSWSNNSHATFICRGFWTCKRYLCIANSCVELHECSYVMLITAKESTLHDIYADLLTSLSIFFPRTIFPQLHTLNTLRCPQLPQKRSHSPILYSALPLSMATTWLLAVEEEKGGAV